ncbi:MAG: ABC transporter ATP-binding protein [Filifactor alocis]|nr:ABC transporter ATP-binding protein [Filifactor alocis]
MNKISRYQLIKRLLSLVTPLLKIIIPAILFGVAGFLCSIFIPVLGGYGILEVAGFERVLSWKTILILLPLLGALRGILRYAEQYSNHLLAFLTLALIRDRIFEVLRKLSPAKLEGKDKGDLIALITSDVELLEVFYAHTISPVAIAVLTSLIMIVYIGYHSVAMAFVALLSYLVIGGWIPLYISRLGRETGNYQRSKFAKMNTYFLESIRGMKEVLQFHQQKNRLDEIDRQTEEMEGLIKKLKDYEAISTSLTELTILFFSLLQIAVGGYLFSNSFITFPQLLLSLFAAMSSYGPVVALSNLANNLLITFASGERVIALLDETPQTEDITNGSEMKEGNIISDDVSFRYQDEWILKNLNLDIQKNKIHAIVGKSGSGKSTLLKLFMRFWDVSEGQVRFSDKPVNEINTESLRRNQSYMTQETFLFQDTIANNIAISKPGASREELVEAAKKASIHDLILSLPQGYDTQVKELGDSLSGGEKQRIGLARAFLHDAPIMFLDEPTSNLDSLNEGVILKSLRDSAKGKTVVIVSHRDSTTAIADSCISMESGRIS